MNWIGYRDNWRVAEDTETNLVQRCKNRAAALRLSIKRDQEELADLEKMLLALATTEDK